MLFVSPAHVQTPRLNKTALLRTGTGTATGTAPPTTAATGSHGLTRTISRPSLLTRPTQSSIARSVSKASVGESGGAAAIGAGAATATKRLITVNADGGAGAEAKAGPKPTRASLLRAGIGARVSSAR
jgi:hypothetical protein